MLRGNSTEVKKAVNMLKPFAIEFQPFINDITGKEKTIQECADMATMERIRGMFIYHECLSAAYTEGSIGSSKKIAEMENLLIEMQTDISIALTKNVQVSNELLKRSVKAKGIWEQLIVSKEFRADFNRQTTTATIVSTRAA